MLLVTAISILTGPNVLTVVLQYINFSISITIGIYQGGDAYVWPHTAIYLSLTNQLSAFCLNLFLLAMLSILLFAFIFLLKLFYSKIGLSLLLNQNVQPYLILLDSVHICGILKFKLTIKNCHTISCIVHCTIWVCAFSFQLLISWKFKQVNP